MQHSHRATPIPASPEEVTAGWLTRVLRDGGTLRSGHVARIALEPVESQGAAAVVARFFVEYADAHVELPGSLIAKFASPHEPMRALMHAVGGYACEVGFYRHFGGDAGISVPYCFHADIDDATGVFILLLEDIHGTHRGDGTLPSINDIETAVRSLAPFHAKWWNDPRLREFEFLRYPGSDADRAFLQQGRFALAAALPVARERFGEKLAPVLVDLAERLLADFDALITRRTEVHHDAVTLVHGDFHPGQMFFPSQGFGRFAVFDWQTVGAGSGGDDLARIVATGLPPGDQRACDMRLVRLYHELLLNHGVAGYDFERCYEAFRLGLATTAIVDIIASVNVDPALIDDAAARGFDVFDAMFTWIASALDAHRVGEALLA